MDRYNPLDLKGRTLRRITGSGKRVHHRQLERDQDHELTLSKLTLKLRISQNLPLFIVVVALVTALAIGTANDMSAAKEMETAANDKLQTLMESCRQALSDYLSTIEQDMRDRDRRWI